MPGLAFSEPVSNKDKQVIQKVTKTQKDSVSADISADMAACARLSNLFGLLLTDLGLRLNSP